MTVKPALRGPGFSSLAAEIEGRFGALDAIDTGADFQTALARAMAALAPYMKSESNVGFMVAVLVATARAEHRLCPHRLALMLGAELSKSVRNLCSAGGHREAALILDTIIETQACADSAQLRFLLQIAATAEGRA